MTTAEENKQSFLESQDYTTLVIHIYQIREITCF